MNVSQTPREARMVDTIISYLALVLVAEIVVLCVLVAG
jgi:hypothetical protein